MAMSISMGRLYHGDVTNKQRVYERVSKKFCFAKNIFVLHVN